MLKKHPLLRPDRESLRFNFEIAKDILQIGTPIVLQQMVISCGFMLLQNIVNGFGETMTASYTVACRLEIYMLVPGGAFTQAMAVYAGQNYGAGRTDRIRKGLGQAVLMAVITALSVAGIVFLFTRQFVGLFALEESAAAFCVRHLHAVCLGIVINAGYSAVNGLFQGVGRTKISMISSVIELSNRLIWAMILKNIIFEAAVWWNEPPAFFLAGLFSYLCFFFYKKWQTA